MIGIAQQKREKVDNSVEKELLGCSLSGLARVKGSRDLRRRPECGSLALPGRRTAQMLVGVQERWVVGKGSLFISLVFSWSESKAMS